MKITDAMVKLNTASDKQYFTFVTPSDNKVAVTVGKSTAKVVSIRSTMFTEITIRSETRVIDDPFLVKAFTNLQNEIDTLTGNVINLGDGSEKKETEDEPSCDDCPERDNCPHANAG